MPVVGSPRTLDLAMVRGKTNVFFLTIVEADGTPLDLTGSTVWFHAAPDGVAVDLSSPSDGITITDAVGGLATLTIDPIESTGVPASGVYSGSCELVLQNGSNSYPLNSGILTVRPNVGTP